MPSPQTLTTWQVPPEQVCPPPQIFPQEPQLLKSAVILVSQPSAAELLQSLNPALQLVMRHAPLVQIAVAFVSAQDAPVSDVN